MHWEAKRIKKIMELKIALGTQMNQTIACRKSDCTFLKSENCKWGTNRKLHWESKIIENFVKSKSALGTKKYQRVPCRKKSEKFLRL